MTRSDLRWIGVIVLVVIVVLWLRPADTRKAGQSFTLQKTYSFVITKLGTGRLVVVGDRFQAAVSSDLAGDAACLGIPNAVAVQDSKIIPAWSQVENRGSDGVVATSPGLRIDVSCTVVTERDINVDVDYVTVSIPGLRRLADQQRVRIDVVQPHIEPLVLDIDKLIVHWR